MPEILNGMNMSIMLGGEMLGYDTDASIDLDRESRETRHKGSGKYKQVEKGLMSASVSAEGLLSVSTNFDNLFDLIESDELADVLLFEQEEAEDGTMKPKVGGKTYSFKCLVNKCSAKYPDNANSTYSFSGESSGKIKKGTYTAP